LVIQALSFISAEVRGADRVALEIFRLSFILRDALLFFGALRFRVGGVPGTVEEGGGRGFIKRRWRSG